MFQLKCLSLPGELMSTCRTLPLIKNLLTISPAFLSFLLPSGGSYLLPLNFHMTVPTYPLKLDKNMYGFVEVSFIYYKVYPILSVQFNDF